MPDPTTLKGKRHVVTLSFDDGFLNSFPRIAAVYEKFHLSACLNVLASSEYGGVPTDIYWRHQHKFGDFGLWNELQARGHEIDPHGWNHTHKQNVPFETAKGLITRCLDTFTEKLKGFDARRTVFNFPYNASTPELDAWLPSVVRGFRTAGPPFNPLPGPSVCKLGTTGFGPGNSEAHCDGVLKDLLARDSGWLVYCLHGLDNEGWGPITPAWLERTLDRLIAIDSVAILPAAKAFALADGL